MSSARPRGRSPRPRPAAAPRRGSGRWPGPIRPSSPGRCARWPAALPADRPAAGVPSPAVACRIGRASSGPITDPHGRRPPGDRQTPSIERRSTGLPARPAYCLGSVPPKRSPRPAATINRDGPHPCNVPCGAPTARIPPHARHSIRRQPLPASELGHMVCRKLRHRTRNCLTVQQRTTIGCAPIGSLRPHSGTQSGHRPRDAAPEHSQRGVRRRRASCASASPIRRPSSCSAQLERPGGPQLDRVRRPARDDTGSGPAGTGDRHHDLRLWHRAALARGETVSVDSHVCPVPELPQHVLVVLHPCSVARRLDQQISHRRSTRSVAGLAATLAHEVKNPLVGHPRRRPAARSRPWARTISR